MDEKLEQVLKAMQAKGKEMGLNPSQIEKACAFVRQGVAQAQQENQHG